MGAMVQTARHETQADSLGLIDTSSNRAISLDLVPDRQLGKDRHHISNSHLYQPIFLEGPAR